MIDLSKPVIIDEFSQKHRVHTSEEIQQVLSNCDGQLVMLRYGNNSLSLIGIVKREGKPRRFNYSNQSDLDLDAMNELLERRVFAKDVNDKSHERIKMKTAEVAASASQAGLLNLAAARTTKEDNKYTAKEYKEAMK